MGQRYVITGVQLGLLVAHPDEETRKHLVDEIIDKQWLCEGKDLDKLLHKSVQR